jgi:hypothetical protein
VYCANPNIGEKLVSNSLSEKCVVTLKLHTKLIICTCISLTTTDGERALSCMQLSYIWINKVIILFTTVIFITQDGTNSICIISYAEMVSNKAVL